MHAKSIVSSFVFLGSAFVVACSSANTTQETSSCGVDGGSSLPEAATPGNGEASVQSPTPNDATITEGGVGVGDGGMSNVASVDFAGTGDVVITAQNATVDTATGEISGASSPDTAYKYFTVDQPLGAGKLAVFVAHSFRFDPSSATNVEGASAVVLVAQDKIEVFGSLSAGARHSTAGAGGSVCTTSGKGGGPGGGGAAQGYDAAGGGSYCGIGGPGNATSDASVAGVGGPAYGSPTLIPLLGGSAGGAEGSFQEGGGGGGAIQLSARGSITVGISGIVNVGGGGGAGNGSAGGSGGAILIEAPAVIIAGILAANGGSGAANTGGPYGQNAQPSSIPARGVPTAGVGSAAGSINGGAGSMTDGNNSSGAGGGAAGRIRINTTTGAATIMGTISPAITTTCFSQGKV
jgi:hypothetical protein